MSNEKIAHRLIFYALYLFKKWIISKNARSTFLVNNITIFSPHHSTINIGLLQDQYFGSLIKVLWLIKYRYYRPRTFCVPLGVLCVPSYCIRYLVNMLRFSRTKRNFISAKVIHSAGDGCKICMHLLSFSLSVYEMK